MRGGKASRLCEQHLERDSFEADQGLSWTFFGMHSRSATLQVIPCSPNNAVVWNLASNILNCKVSNRAHDCHQSSDVGA